MDDLIESNGEIFELSIRRESTLSLSLRDVDICVDNILFCSISNGSTKRIKLTKGNHILTVYLGKKIIGNENIVINDNGFFTFKIGNNFSNSIIVLQNSCSSNNISGNYNATNKSNNAFGWLIAIMIILFLIFFILPNLVLTAKIEVLPIYPK